MTRGELYNIVHELADAKGLEVVAMKVGPIGFHFEFEKAGDTRPPSQRPRRGWSVNNGDLAAHSPIGDFLESHVRRIAGELDKANPLESVRRDPATSDAPE